MIDIESDVFSTVAKVLRETYGARVSGEYEPTPSSFPAVTIVETSNTVYQRMISSSGMENAAQLMYEVSIYTNTIGSKKLEAKAILKTADEAFSKMGFVRTYYTPIANLEDASIYRIVARYEAIVDKDLWIYATT